MRNITREEYEAGELAMEDELDRIEKRRFECAVALEGIPDPKAFVESVERLEEAANRLCDADKRGSETGRLEDCLADLRAAKGDG